MEYSANFESSWTAKHPSDSPKGVALDPAKYQALSKVTLYRVGKSNPEINELSLAASADQMAVNAVMATFETESDKVAQRLQEDAHPAAASKATKAPAKAPPARPKAK